MATWNTDKPALANTIAADVPDIEENLQELHDVITAITNGTLGTTAPASFEIDTIVAGSVVGPEVTGLAIHSKFEWKATDEIYISAASYHHHGTTEQVVYWDSKLTFAFSNLGTSDWSYLYLDDSAIVTADTNLISATELVDSVTEPVWSETKHGWYNGEDRCIFAVLTDSSDYILEFFHDGNLVIFADKITNRAAATIGDTNWHDVILTIPKFTTKANIALHGSYGNTTVHLSWRTNGQTGTTGHEALWAGSGENDVNTLEVITDSSQIIEIAAAASTGTSTIAEYTNGWYFPIGM